MPTTEEWSALTSYLGGEGVVSDKVKETGTTHWASPNSGSNETGFTALPGGIRWSDEGETSGWFSSIGFDGSWWSATSNDPGGNGADFFSTSSGFSNEPLALKIDAISVRCIKDN